GGTIFAADLIYDDSRQRQTGNLDGMFAAQDAAKLQKQKGAGNRGITRALCCLSASLCADGQRIGLGVNEMPRRIGVTRSRCCFGWSCRGRRWNVNDRR